jgi:hypothetical protein
MKKHHEVVAILTGIFFFFVFYSCESTNSGAGSSVVISSYNSSDSHRVGENCMNCHISNGSGDGVFSVAGTVYNESLSSPLPNSTVRIYASADEGSDPLFVIEVDAKGNFYTTENINFGEGLYTSVEGPEAEIFMESAITNGSCNSCHGVSTERIWAE